MYEMTLSPIQIGGARIKNRIARTGHATIFSPGNQITDDLVQYHLARAKACVGLSVLEAAAVHPSSILALANLDDSIIPGYEKFMRAITPTGMKVFQQLWHGGHIYPQPNGAPPWAASAVPSHVSGVAPQVMRPGQIAELVAAFCAAARRCEAGGLHGVEVHAGHGYLVAQFLSPVINQRTDDYGGSFENRTRFVREILRAIRTATSPGFALGVRVSQSVHPEILSAADVTRITALLEAEGLIDYVNVSWGDYYLSHLTVGGMEVPSGYQLPQAEAVAAARIPRLVTGRYRTLEEAEQVLRSGVADLVSMVRATIADPDLVAKTIAGNLSQVRPCIACNQGCLGGAAAFGRMGCVVNIAVGRETTLDEHRLEPAAQPLRILVVGGGPAGMEAARIAALRGHRVTLAEASPRLGGAIELLKQAPKTQAAGDIAFWLEAEIYRLGVEVRLSTYLTEDDIAVAAYDHVIVATGALQDFSLRQVQYPVRDVEAASGADLLSSVELLSGRRKNWGATAVVVDEVGHYEAIACAEFLLERDIAVTFITRHNMFAPGIQPTLRAEAALQRLYAGGKFRLVTGVQITAIHADTCEVRPMYAPAGETIPSETIVWVPIRAGDNALFEKLRERGTPATLVGDAVAARTLQHAIAEGHLAARNL